MIVVDGAAFNMGSLTGAADEQPVTSTVVNTFSISKYEITVAQFRNFCTSTQRIMPVAPTWGWQDLNPIVNVSWNDATAYCQWLSEQTGKKYRLPTEAEWEFAARGGKLSKGTTFSGSNNLDEVAWYIANSDSTTHPCGQKKANELGLFDMSGNAGEWCSSLYAPYPFVETTSSAQDRDRIVRGSHYKAAPNDNRVAFRGHINPGFMRDFIGFRIARNL